MENKEVEQVTINQQFRRYVGVTLWLFFPLLLLIVLDKIGNKKNIKNRNREK